MNAACPVVCGLARLRAVGASGVQRGVERSCTVRGADYSLSFYVALDSEVRSPESLKPLAHNPQTRIQPEL